MFFIIYQLADYWSVMKLNCRPLTLNLFKPFLKKRNRSGETLYIIFYKIFEKKFCYILITWPLNLNFHHLVKRIILPAKFHFNLHWGNFYNMLLFRFKKDLKDQNHSSSDSNHQIKIPLPARFPISPMGRYPRASHRCREHGRTWINT